MRSLRLVTRTDSDRKRRGAWFTPPHLVDQVVAAVIDRAFVAGRGNRPLRIIDPACGDGRFLAASLAAIRRLGGEATAVGVDIDQTTVDDLAGSSDTEVICADALRSDRLIGQAGTFDLVIGNPPFLSQMSVVTTRGGSSSHGGGPYADAAAEFLALAADLVDSDGGRVAFVLPQSLLSARDAGGVRTGIDQRATMIWSAWTGDLDFDAQVVTCAVAFEFGNADRRPGSRTGSWSHVVTARAGVPPMPTALVDPDPATGVLGDRARLNANFRDEYYGMVPAVDDHDAGPPLITSGLIDPGRSLWGERPVRFAKRRFEAPRLELGALDSRMQRWAHQRLVPKVLIANQTAIIEAVCDPAGLWLPAVPVVTAYPHTGQGLWEIATVLTSPAASAWAWHQRGGTGMSSRTIRLGPAMLAGLPWPSGRLDEPAEALKAGDIEACGRGVDVAYGLGERERRLLLDWWTPILDRVTART